MLSNPVRAFPIYDITLSSDVSPFIITTDFSTLGLSAILSQIQWGKERLIACASRKTSPSEKNYSSLKGEMRSIIFSLEKFDRFINLQSFFYIVTDSIALKHLQTLKTASKIFQRWSAIIFSYPCRILHRHGKIPIHADVLSRTQPIMDEVKATDMQYDHICSLSLSPHDITHSTMDCIAKELKEILLEPANTTGMYKVVKIKSANSRQKSNKPWFNSQSKISMKQNIYEKLQKE